MIKKIFFGGLAVLCLLIGIFIYNRETYVGEKVDPLTYFDEFAANTNNLVYEDKRVDLSEPIVEKDGKLFVCYSFANQYVSDTIFYDKNEAVMTITNNREVIRLNLGENNISYGAVSGTYTLFEEQGELYLSSNLLSDIFSVSIDQGLEGKLFIATDHRKVQQIAELKKKASLRTHPQDKSTVVQVLKKESMIYVYEETDGFARVRSEDGVIGYIKLSDMFHKKQQEASLTPTVEQWQVNPLGSKVNLVWDQITVKADIDWKSSKYDHMNEVNVISPTWFEFADENGNLVDRGTASYVKQAHSRGVEVWPILSHSFENTSLTAKILSSTEKRQRVIDQILDYAQAYGFDGINIDIENIQTDTSDVWVQFMRELYPQLKNAGLKVSVDVYMPSGWSEHYEREKVANSCDYFIVMAYDQHWSGSEMAGSVSEIQWVNTGIEACLEEVPAEKLVLGMPFYTRLWLEGSDGLSSKAYSMSSIEELIASWQVTPIEDEASGQHYVEYMSGDGLYKVWLEDFYSISKRVDLVEKYDLAGYGVWKLGLETDDIWKALARVK